MAGRWIVPCRPPSTESIGGENSPPSRWLRTASTASSRIAGVKSTSCSMDEPWSSKGGGFVGNGCVGESTSPGRSVSVSTARSSMGQTGSPVTRSKT